MIQISGLGFQYEGSSRFALDGIDLHVKKGAFLGVIGSSGAGKTTLLNAMNGVIPHYVRGAFYGTVRLNGQDTVDTPPEQIAHTAGSVRQDVESQFVASVVEDELLFGLENFSVPRLEIERRIVDALHMTGISALRDRTISTLSGGQKQKVAIAALLALMPELLILDEPTGELDPQSSRQVFTLLRELNEKKGITVIVVEQKVMLLSEFSKELAVMKEGKILLHGPVRDVLEKSEEMERAGVNCPRVVTLANRLRGAGLYAGASPISVAEAETAVRGILG